MNKDNTIKVAALTGGIKTPSARFRIRQYINRLAGRGVSVEEHIPFFQKSCGWPSPFKAAARIPALFRTRDADVIWLNKELVQGYPTFEKLLKRPRVLDADDALWLSRPLGFLVGRCTAAAMDAVIAGNTYLANYFEKYCSKIHILPTGIDLNRYHPPEIEPDNISETFVIGWTGLACNYDQLDRIADTLNAFLRSHQKSELLLVSNKPWNTNRIPHDKIRFVQWSPENETALLHQMSVGIMPLTDTPWSRGKCSFKMLQYMASGLPVIVSPVGMNTDVLNKGEVGFSAETENQWRESLEVLYKDHQLRITMGRNGHSVINEHYDADKIADRLAEIFSSLI